MTIDSCMVYIYIYANMNGFFVDGIHGTPYIAAPLGSYHHQPPIGSLVLRSSKKKPRRSTRSKAASTTGPKPVVMITNLLDPEGDDVGTSTIQAVVEMEYEWNINGLSMEYEWNMNGTWMEY